MYMPETSTATLFGKYNGKETFVPSVLDGKVEGNHSSKRAQVLLIRTKSLVHCRKDFMVIGVLDKRYSQEGF